jgi:TetR/AcrR family transcriptional regulator, regulator of cefoperazone and chloramphenicol sensitivity
MTVDSLRPTRNRPYHSVRRQAQAEATRAAIAEAARRLFVEKGWAGTTVRAVARAAEVAETTVYATYGRKAGLAQALIDAITDAAEPTRQAAELDAAHSDPAGQLAAMIGFDCRLFEHGADVIAVLRDAGRSEPDLAAAYQAGRAQATELRHVVFGAWPPHTLRPGLDLGDATATYAALCNIDVHRVLTEEHGWAPARVEHWLTESATRLLLA